MRGSGNALCTVFTGSLAIYKSFIVRKWHPIEAIQQLTYLSLRSFCACVYADDEIDSCPNDVHGAWNADALSTTSKNCHHHKVTNITSSPT